MSINRLSQYQAHEACQNRHKLQHSKGRAKAAGSTASNSYACGQLASKDQQRATQTSSGRQDPSRWHSCKGLAEIERMVGAFGIAAMHSTEAFTKLLGYETLRDQPSELVHLLCGGPMWPPWDKLSTFDRVDVWLRWLLHTQTPPVPALRLTSICQQLYLWRCV